MTKIKIRPNSRTYMDTSQRQVLRVINVMAALFALVLVAVPAIVRAQDTRPAEYETADRELNKVYRIIIGRLARDDAERLRQAQRLWISFRDADCLWGWGHKPDCMIARTDERTRQLQESTLFDRNGVLIKWDKRD